METRNCQSHQCPFASQAHGMTAGYGKDEAYGPSPDPAAPDTKATVFSTAITEIASAAKLLADLGATPTQAINIAKDVWDRTRNADAINFVAAQIMTADPFPCGQTTNPQKGSCAKRPG